MGRPANQVLLRSSCAWVSRALASSAQPSWLLQPMTWRRSLKNLHHSQRSKMQVSICSSSSSRVTVSLLRLQQVVSRAFPLHPRLWSKDATGLASNRAIHFAYRSILAQRDSFSTWSVQRMVSAEAWRRIGLGGQRSRIRIPATMHFVTFTRMTARQPSTDEFYAIGSLVCHQKESRLDLAHSLQSRQARGAVRRLLQLRHPPFLHRLRL